MRCARAVPTTRARRSPRMPTASARPSRRSSPTRPSPRASRSPDLPSAPLDMRCMCVAYYAHEETYPHARRSTAHVELCEVGGRRRRPVPRLARRDPRELFEGHDGVCRALYARHAGRDAPGLCGPGASVGPRGYGGVVRLRAEAVEAAEELRREDAVRQRARREVIRSRAAAAAFPPRAVAAFFAT